MGTGNNTKVDIWPRLHMYTNAYTYTHQNKKKRRTKPPHMGGVIVLCMYHKTLKNSNWPVKWTF